MQISQSLVNTFVLWNIFKVCIGRVGQIFKKVSELDAILSEDFVRTKIYNKIVLKFMNHLMK